MERAVQPVWLAESDLRIYQQAASRIGNCRFPSGCLVAILQGGGGGSPIIFCLKEMNDEGMYCSFFAWPFVFEDSLKISSVFCGQKVVFMAQERLSSLALIHTCYLTYMNLKEVVDLFLRSTQGSSRAWHTIELQIMMMWCKLSE